MSAEQIRFLLSPVAIRQRARQLTLRARQGKSDFYRIDDRQLAVVRDAVIATIRESYPTLEIPVHSRWRHFDAGGGSRRALLDAELQGPALERARAKVDLTVVSVFLDAGAGMAWQYIEPDTAQTFRRSEGLAVASFHMFRQGAFSSDSAAPCRADAEGLEAFSTGALEHGFQVGKHNPLVGLEGRAALMQALGRALRAHPTLFGEETPRPGGLVDALREWAEPMPRGRRRVKAETVLDYVLTGFSSIFPGRITLDGTPLGDVWVHSGLGAPGTFESMVPLHKLSQWLTYSLYEPLAEAGIDVADSDALTGLAEYRNGGLFVDHGVVVPLDAALAQTRFSPSDEAIVEWRALTVALLDELLPLVREGLNKTPDELPLAAMLEGGTWSAGRAIAKQKRPDGGPPFLLDSDGTVF